MPSIFLRNIANKRKQMAFYGRNVFNGRRSYVSLDGCQATNSPPPNINHTLVIGAHIGPIDVISI